MATENKSTSESTQPASEEKPNESGPVWPTLSTDHPLSKFIDHHSEAIKEADYDEVYGINLRTASIFHRNLILQKFLRANANDVDKAQAQLLATLKWRKSFNALGTKDEVFSKTRFGGLGYVTILENVPESSNRKDVASFNVYGAVTDNKATFEDLDGFLRWRVGLMELSLARLNLSEASEPIPDYGQGPDPYQGLQIHDYLSVSFLRQDPYAKAAASKAIETFKAYYPETLSRKFFVNVPILMGWMFAAMKLVLSRETVKKFTVITYSKDLAQELGPSVPSAYGGTGADLESAETLRVE